MEWAATLREARRRAGLSQSELAARARTSQTAVSAYENAARQPSLRTYARLMSAAGAEVSVGYPSRPPRERSGRELAQAGRTLAQVIGLAEALPVKHRRELRYPRLGPPPGHR